MGKKAYLILFNNLIADGMNKFLNWFYLQLGILNLLLDGNISNSECKTSVIQRQRVEQNAPSEVVQIIHCVCVCVCICRHGCKAAHLHLNTIQGLCAWKVIFQCDCLKPVEAMPLCAEIASYTICIIYGRYLCYSASLGGEEKAA